MTAETPTSPAPPPPWLAFEEIRVAKVESLDNCLARCPRDAALPLLVVQATFDFALLAKDEEPTFRRRQYVCAWPCGTCDAAAVTRLPTRGLLLPYAMEWDGCPAVGFELCERMSPMRDATRLKRMRVRPLRTYMVLIAGETFAPRHSGRCWQKVAATPHAIRPLARRVRLAAA